MAHTSLGRTLRNLAVAMLNATLILVAVCLWLGWSTLSAAERVSLQIGEAAQAIVPVRAEITGLTAEIAGVRSDIATLGAGASADGAAMVALDTRIAAVEAQLADLNDRLAALGADPEALIDRAVRTTFATLGGLVSDGLLGTGGSR